MWVYRSPALCCAAIEGVECTQTYFQSDACPEGTNFLSYVAYTVVKTDPCGTRLSNFCCCHSLASSSATCEFNTSSSSGSEENPLQVPLRHRRVSRKRPNEAGSSRPRSTRGLRTQSLHRNRIRSLYNTGNAESNRLCVDTVAPFTRPHNNNNIHDTPAAETNAPRLTCGGKAGSPCRALMLLGKKNTQIKQAWRKRVKPSDASAARCSSRSSLHLSPSAAQSSAFPSASQSQSSAGPSLQSMLGNQSALKTSALSILNQLDVSQLQDLNAALETASSSSTPCVMVPNEEVTVGGAVRVPPAVLSLIIWRWPDLPIDVVLRPIPPCSSNSLHTCINPHHSSISCDTQSGEFGRFLSNCNRV